MDIRRTILWMIFVFSIFAVWNNWQTYNGQPSLFGSAPQTTTDSHSANGTPAAPSAVSPTGTAAVAANAAPAVASETVTITTDVFKLNFDTLGAQIVYAELLKHPASEDRSQPTILLDNSAVSQYIVQSGLVAPQGQNKHFPDQNTLFRLVSNETSLTGDTLPVVFEAESDGIKVTRTYTFHRNSYKIDVKDQVSNISAEPQSPSLYLQIARDSNDPAGSSSFYPTFTGMAVYSDAERFQKIDFSDIDKKKADHINSATDGWISMIQHFFVTAWIPQEGKERYIDTRKASNTLYAISAVEPLGVIAPGSTVESLNTLWVGPQDQKALSAVDPTLDLVVDYGWLTMLAKPMFTFMIWLHSLLGNWGWTIVVLTIIIKIVLFPLSASSYRSMAKMKNVAPRMQALKEKFGDDRQKLNTAMMEMYRTEKINPLGGCFPILIQIPVFLTLYRVLLSSVEMRGAGWIGWITDLSLRDPYFILPAIMMATMFLQIKLNPTPPDPMQARIMMLMPLVFGAMMFMFPSGLVLYWVVNNILSIAQQWYITRNLNKAANDAILTHK
ncbi:MAG: membrane protein insertase YidC [Alcaligenaceae bacterium]|nr:membrane protein insertase YidC [Alcaligenaceae bacterium]